MTQIANQERLCFRACNDLFHCRALHKECSLYHRLLVVWTEITFGRRSLLQKKKFFDKNSWRLTYSSENQKAKQNNQPRADGQKDNNEKT